jgi:adenylosuccinate lyase
MDEGLSSLSALSPLDGRYRSRISNLSDFFSEQALIRYRVSVELHFYLFFTNRFLGREISPSTQKKLLSILSDFDTHEAEKVKTIESKTRHDVKAVEYYLQSKFDELTLGGKEYIHIGLTSDDVNTLARGMALSDALRSTILPSMAAVIDSVSALALEYADQPMLARTHGQPAVPTTLGKELANFAVRLRNEYTVLQTLPIEGKMTGAVGNYNALTAAFPTRDVVTLCDEFVVSLGLVSNSMTTQILPADAMIRVFDSIRRFNTILLGFVQDMWRYISEGYFLLKVVADEVGSSTMPQKVNPIDFENAEGNIGLANSLFGFFGEKLPISRLQRDLSDSTVYRSVGSAFGYSVLAYASVLSGMQKLTVNVSHIEDELGAHWEIVMEGLQTLLRLSGDSTAYEKLKQFSRGEAVTEEKVHAFIDELSVSVAVKETLRSITPHTYIGKAGALVRSHITIPEKPVKKRITKEQIV